MASAVMESSWNVHFSAGPRRPGLQTPCLLGEPGVLYIRGEVDASVVDELRRWLQVLATGSSPTVAVDLAGVSFISCAALAPLVEARQYLGRRLHLRATSPAADRLLRLTELTAHFGLCAPLGAARQ